MDVFCPHCGGRVTVPDGRSGLADNCSLCTRLFIVPAPEQPNQPAPESAPERVPDIPDVDVAEIPDLEAPEPVTTASDQLSPPVGKSRRNKRRKAKGARPRFLTAVLAFLLPYWFEFLLIGASIVFGLCLVPLPLFFPRGLAIALTLGLAMFAAAYLTTSYFCFDDGEAPPVRELFYGPEVPAGFVFFVALYLVGYPFYWWVIHVQCMLGYPRKYLPLLFVQAYSLLVVAASVLVHFAREDIWAKF